MVQEALQRQAFTTLLQRQAQQQQCPCKQVQQTPLLRARRTFNSRAYNTGCSRRSSRQRRVAAPAGQQPQARGPAGAAGDGDDDTLQMPCSPTCNHQQQQLDPLQGIQRVQLRTYGLLQSLLTVDRFDLYYEVQLTNWKTGAF